MPKLQNWYHCQLVLGIEEVNVLLKMQKCCVQNIILTNNPEFHLHVVSP